MVRKFLYDKAHDIDVDKEVLSDPKASALGRFAVTGQIDQVGGFKTSTLRNVAVTAPYFHDGSVKTLRDVVKHYNNGGFLPPHKRANDFLSGGIRPLNLSDQQIDDLVVFLESLTSPPYASLAKKVAWTDSGLPASMKSTVMKQIALAPQPDNTNTSVAIDVINVGAQAGGEK
jgi:Cytochrome c peroxidase